MHIIRQEAAGALWNLSFDDRNRESIATAGGVEALVCVYICHIYCELVILLPVHICDVSYKEGTDLRKFSMCFPPEQNPEESRNHFMRKSMSLVLTFRRIEKICKRKA
jgi:hypothetical protein